MTPQIEASTPAWRKVSDPQVQLKHSKAASWGRAQDIGGWGAEGSHALVAVSLTTRIPGVTQARKSSSVTQRAAPAGAEPVAMPPPGLTDAGLCAGPQGARGKESEHSTRTRAESRITRQKGKTYGVDKKQKPGAVREHKRRRLWFQRVTPTSGRPRDTPDPHRRRGCLPAGISMNTVTVTHVERHYRFDSGDRNGLTITWRLKILPGPKGKNQKTDHSNSPPSDLPQTISEGYLRPCWVLLLVIPHRRKKTKMRESHPNPNERFEPGRPLGIFSYFYGCWKVLQGGRGLNAFRKLQSMYHGSLPLEVRKVKSSLESIYSEVWRKKVKTLAPCEEACGTKEKKMVHCWKEERHVLTHNMVRFGPRTLVGARRARDEFLGTAHIRRTAKKKRGNKIPVLTHSLVRFCSRTLVGAKGAADISDQEQAAGVRYQKRGFSACQL
ncbi:uncharacterized protein [Callorhinus ursinus]|uniref:uncharacterized protein n=1 Tax=Callorhinus ursinus TaxID=34884 RepID=UPI003CD00C99